MENTTLLTVKIALVRDENSGKIHNLVVEVSEENAALVLREQTTCALCREGGALYSLINAYAKLIGYVGAYFIEAFAMAEEK